MKPIRTVGPIVLGSLLVFSPLIEGGTTHLPVLIVRLVLLATMTAWIIGSMRSGWLILYPCRLYPAILAFIVWAIFSVFHSPYTASSLQWLVSILGYAALFVLVLQVVETFAHVRLLVVLFLGMSLLEAAMGYYQAVWLGSPRVSGTFFNANFFALYEATIFTLAFGWLCFHSPPRESVLPKPILWATAGIVALAFLLAQSRGALVAMVIGVGFVGCYRYGRVFLAVLLLGLVAVSTIPNPLQQRLVTIGAQDPYAYTRLEIWKDSLKRVADHPWGVGLGMYKYLSFEYRFPVESDVARYGKRAESAHNEYLQMAVELGVAGLLIFLVGAGVGGKVIREALAGPLEGWERGTVVGLAGGVLGILGHASVDAVFHEPAIVFLLVLSVGLIVVMGRLKSPHLFPARRVAWPYRPVRVALILVLALCLALLTIRPALAWYVFEEGEREMSSGQADRALNWFTWATRIDPGTTAYHDAVGHAAYTLYRRTGDIQRLGQTMESLRVGLELNPLDARLAHRLGALFVLLAAQAPAGPDRDSLRANAITFFRQAIQLDPYSPFNYLEIGTLHRIEGRVQEAMGWLRLATTWEPNFLPARVMVTELALEGGQREAAVAEYAEILKIQQRFKGRVLSNLERQYLEIGHDHLRRMLDAGPRS
jgi:O-antigen ligase